MAGEKQQALPGTGQAAPAKPEKKPPLKLYVRVEQSGTITISGTKDELGALRDAVNTAIDRWNSDKSSTLRVAAGKGVGVLIVMGHD